jgi:hypothetical protein
VAVPVDQFGRDRGVAGGLATGSVGEAAIQIEVVDEQDRLAIYGCNTCLLLDLAGMQHVLPPRAGRAPLKIEL